MKTLWSIIALLLSTCSLVLAQSYPTDKGSTILSGSLAFSSAGGDLYEEEKDRMVSITVAPSVFTFITPGVALGGKVLFARNAVGDDSNSRISFGPHFALFFTGMQKPARKEGGTFPYLGASALYNIYSSKYTSYSYGWNGVEQEEESESENGTTFSFGFGIMNMLARNLALNAEIGYQIDNFDDSTGNYYQRFESLPISAEWEFTNFIKTAQFCHG